MFNGVIENCEDVQAVLSQHIIYSTTDRDGIITDASEAFCQETGYERGELLGRTHNMLRAEDTPDTIYEDLWSTIENDEIWRGEMKNRRKNGEIYWVEAIIRPMYDQKRHKEGYIAIRHNITREKMIEERAMVDELTGVYNRRKTNQELTRFIKNFVRYGDRFAAVMIDIDYFKNFNDTYGHLIGDEVLKNVSLHMRENIRAGDFFARWGGEEFILLLPHMKEENLLAVCDKLRHIIRSNASAFLLYNFGISERVTCSFGATVSVGDDNVDSILGRIDRALYQAKEAGRDQVVTL